MRHQKPTRGQITHPSLVVSADLSTVSSILDNKATVFENLPRQMPLFWPRKDTGSPIRQVMQGTIGYSGPARLGHITGTVGGPPYSHREDGIVKAAH
jgi:hypothetical protein